MTISKGPSFSGTTSTIGMGMTVFAVVIVVAALIIADGAAKIVTPLFFAAIAAVAIEMMLRVEIVEIDVKKATIREYTRFFWFKSGEFEKFNKYNRLVLYIDRYTTTEGNSVMGNKRKEHSQGYEVALFSDLTGEKIVLYEGIKYPDTKKKLVEIAQQLHMEPIDDFADELARSKTKNKRRR